MSAEKIRNAVLRNQTDGLNAAISTYLSQNRGIVTRFKNSIVGPDFEELLRFAISKHKNNSVKVFINRNKELSSIKTKTPTFGESEEKTTLYVAVENNNKEAVHLLLNSRCRIDPTHGYRKHTCDDEGSSQGETRISPLYIAIERGYKSIVSLFLKKFNLQQLCVGYYYKNPGSYEKRIAPLYQMIEKDFIGLAYKLAQKYGKYANNNGVIEITTRAGRGPSGTTSKTHTPPSHLAASKRYLKLCKYLNELSGLIISPTKNWVKIYTWNSKKNKKKNKGIKGIGVGHAAIEVCHNGERAYLSLWPKNGHILGDDGYLVTSLKDDKTNEDERKPEKEFIIYSLATDNIIKKMLQIKANNEIKYRITGRRFFESGETVNMCSGFVFDMLKAGKLHDRFPKTANLGFLLPMKPDDVGTLASSMQNFEKKHYPYISTLQDGHIANSKFWYPHNSYRLLLLAVIGLLIMGWKYGYFTLFTGDESDSNLQPGL